MTRQEFVQLTNYLQRMDKMMAAIVNLINTVDPNLLPDEDDVTGAAPANPQQTKSTPTQNTAQPINAPVLPENLKRKVVITNPELNSLVKDIKAQQEEEVEAIAAASGIIKREAPFDVEVTYVDRTDDLQPIAKVVDIKNGYYNFINVSIKEADDIQDILSQGEKVEFTLTQAELDKMEDKWIPLQKVEDNG